MEIPAESAQKRKKPGLHFSREKDILTFAVCAMKIGSRAIFRCEPCQVLTEAAVSIRRMCCGVARSERRRFFFCSDLCRTPEVWYTYRDISETGVFRLWNWN